MKRFTACALPALVALLLLSCGKSETLRRLLYPPDFHYMTNNEVRGDMGRLALQVQALDQVMTPPDHPRPEDQQRVIEILVEMQTLARHLTQGEQSNHPQIDRDAPMLLRRIDRALFGARMNPPNYYFAGTVSSGCTYCHGARHRAERKTRTRNATDLGLVEPGVALGPPTRGLRHSVGPEYATRGD